MVYGFTGKPKMNDKYKLEFLWLKNRKYAIIVSYVQGDEQLLMNKICFAVYLIKVELVNIFSTLSF